MLVAGDRAPGRAAPPGVETPFGVTWDAGINRGVHRRHGFRQEFISQNPAETVGLYPQKGTLRPGSDADMVLVDPGWPRTGPYPERNPHLAVGSSIFMGRQCLSGPVTVLRRGKSSADPDEITGSPSRPLPPREPHPKGLTPHLPSLSGTSRNIGQGSSPIAEYGNLSF